MKKRIIAIFTIAVMALVTFASVAACDNTANDTADYTITVLSPDETALSDVTVNWMNNGKAAGTAKTDADGKATVKLAVGTYSIELADIGEGLSYTSLSVTADMRNATMILSVKRIDYSVTVKDKNDAFATNVTVNWMSGGKIVGTASTDANGKATCTLDYGDYTVTLSNLPQDNLSGGSKTVSGANPSVEFKLHSGESQDYLVTVKSEGGLLFKKQAVIVYMEGDEFPLTAGETNDKGEYRFSYEAGNYTVAVENVPQGYSPAEVSLTADKTEGEIKLHSEIITTAPAANTTYVIGDIFHDYEFTTPYEIDGKQWSKSVSEILKDKKALIINNWGTQCYYCVQEMPAMQEFYEKYSDKVEIVAVNNYRSQYGLDTDATITSYYESNRYTFPMVRDVNNFTAKFGIIGWPMTIIIDKYGAIARIESGGIASSATWERMVGQYIADDYVQTFTPGDKVSDSINTELSKPDVKIPEDHYEKLASAINNVSSFPKGASITWRGEEEYEYAWPFLFGAVEGVSNGQEVMYASNSGKASSLAFIYADVTVNAGKVLTFDYYADTEKYDGLRILWDSKIVCEIKGASDGWQTCYLYTDLVDGDHVLAIAYTKDGSGNVGRDNVYIRNVRFCEISEITDSIDMLRGAAYGHLSEGDTKYPYYADLTVDSNGYYHVDTSKLQNPAYAGVDESPMIFANLLNVTNWANNASLSQLILDIDETTNEYVYSCEFAINGIRRDYRADLMRYLLAANSSDIPGMVPVNERLRDLLIGFTANVSGEASHPKEWLELCYYYSRYGSDDDLVGNPILGLMPETAVPVTTDELIHANLTRNTRPFPTYIFSFTPSESALYKIESFIPDDSNGQFAAQIWLYDDSTSPLEPLLYDGDARISIDAKNEQNFVVYYTMKANRKYYLEVAFLMAEMGEYDFSITKQTTDVTVLAPASEDIYDAILDDKGNIVGSTLAGAIEYGIDENNYYRVKNPDGTLSEQYIYLDVLHANTIALGTIPLKNLINMKVHSPVFDEKLGRYPELDYTYFDFRYCVMYYNYTENGQSEVDFIAKVELDSTTYPEFKDYTQILQGYVDQALANTGELYGLVKVDKQLADILKMFIQLRVNGVWAEVVPNGESITIERYEIEEANENEWLRFCWYFKEYKAVNTNEQ